MTAELIVRDRRAVAQADAVPAATGPTTPMRLLEIATAQGADLTKLEQLMALQERWEANEARKAFVAAMAAFKVAPPVITKNKRVHYTSSKGTVDYVHATHDEVTNKIAAAMAPHGLSFRWRTEQIDGGQIKVTCVVEHVLGHSESVSLTSGRDDSGSKNNIQAVGSTVTYLQRYTLLSVTGLSTSEVEDDDGRGAGETAGPKRITAEQLANLEALITEVGANRENFLKFCRVDRLDDILAENYSRAVRALEDRRSAQK